MARLTMYYTARDCAEALNKSTLTIYLWTKNGKIRSSARTASGMHLYTKEDIARARKLAIARTRH